MHSETLKSFLFIAAFAVLALCPLSWAFRTAGDVPHSDAYDNVEAAHGIYQNIFAPAKRQPAAISTYREPLYPFFLAAQFWFSNDSGLKAHGLECFRTPGLCPSAILASKRVNWLFHCLSTILTGLAVLYFTRRKRYALLAMGGISLNAVMVTAVNVWMSEPQALFFMLVHSLALWGMFHAPRRKTCAILAALVLAALIWTKAIYFYLLPVYAVIALARFILVIAGRPRADEAIQNPDAGPLRRVRNDKFAFPLVLMTAVAAICIMPAWLARSGDSQSFRRCDVVLAIRAEYDAMPWSDIPVALLWFTPEIGEDLTQRLYGPEAAARFDRQADDSYYRRVKKGRGLSYELAARENIPLRKAAASVIMDNALKHIILTPVFTYQGLFIPKKIAINNNRFPPAKIIAQIVNNLLLPFCLFGCLYFIRRRQHHWLPLALPALYGITAHAALTHFWPRYSLPFLGIGLVFAFVVWHSFKQPPAKVKL